MKKNNVCTSDDEFEDDDENDREEGFRMLLGGLSSDLMQTTEWCEEENDPDHDEDEDKGQSNTGTYLDQNEKRTMKHNHSDRNPDIPVTSNLALTCEWNCKNVWERAFCIDSRGNAIRPHVKIVNMSHINNRGYALVATKNIPRGQVIFSEKAVESVQIPNVTFFLSSSTVSLLPQRKIYKVRGCQHCFKSMEPASCFRDKEKLASTTTVTKDCSELPMSHLWPVAEYDESTNERKTQHMNACNLARSTCQDCGATFCSKVCHQIHDSFMGSCCICSGALCEAYQSIQNQNKTDAETQVNPAILLAVRMFCSSIHRYRQNPNKSSNSNSGEKGGDYPFYFMCGEESDLSKLELGKQVDSYYTLEHVHSFLVKILSLTKTECDYFSLSYFHKLVSVIARNAIGVTTQSPFKIYYSSLLRNIPGGRGSSQHTDCMKKVAHVLGAKDGKLDRQMDRLVEDQCAIQTISLFTLTCRINHSCDPCAQVQSQVFVDNHIDLVALRDIEEGEEITISYINLGKNAGRVATDRVKRMRELQSRYLFLCDCVRCRADNPN